MDFSIPLPSSAAATQGSLQVQLPYFTRFVF